jgi:hypothetical protein
MTYQLLVHMDADHVHTFYICIPVFFYSPSPVAFCALFSMLKLGQAIDLTLWSICLEFVILRHSPMVKISGHILKKARVESFFLLY